MRYYFGTRGPNLTDALAAPSIQPATADLLAGLCHEDRAERARALGGELARLAAALDEQGLWR